MAKRKVEVIDDLVPVRHAIMSVSDKSGLEDFVPELIKVCPEIMIYSTGGTYGRLVQILGDAAVKNVAEVSRYIGQPETEGGLVKTLDFKLFLGYLTETYSEAHQQDLKRTNSVPIDLVVFNLYPFQEKVKEKGIDVEDARGNIDVGGPSALRAAGKNWHRIATVVDPNDYSALLAEIKGNKGRTKLKTRFELHKKVFRHLANYNTAIADYVEGVSAEEAIKPYIIMNKGE
ncbi:hypothetical protein KY342_04875 [Candidatus Woesearchaeota archaeon]|nr:hypothetical protein [Candidatus Woesearchaeota archaeon]